MFPEVRGECEELNNSPQIPTAVTADGQPLTRYAANSRRNGAAKRVWRPRLENKRVWRPMVENKRVWRPRIENRTVWRTRSGLSESGDLASRARVPCAKGDNGTGEEVPHLGSGAAHRRATSITGTSGTEAVGRTPV